MRFAATHKAVSYLMVGAAFLMLALTGELPILLLLLSAVGIVASYFFDPQGHPLMMRRGYTYAWYAVLALSAALLFADSARGEPLWDSGTRFLCVFLVAKLWQRRSNTDYLQAYLASFLMILVASLLGTGALYAVCLLFYVVFSTWTLTLFHLRREMEENYLLKHLPGKNGQAAESERVEVERILNSRRVVGSSFLIASGLVSVGIFLTAGLLFLLLPRVGVTLDLPLRKRGALLTGFAEQIRLGGHGLLRDNPKVVMRVELSGDALPTTPGEPRLPRGLRFRGMAFDHYEHGLWARRRLLPERALPVAPALGYHQWAADAFAAPAPKVALRSEVYLEPLDTAVLFVPWPAGDRPIGVVLPDSLYATGAASPAVLGAEDDLLLRATTGLGGGSSGRHGGLHYTVLSTAAAPLPRALLPAEQKAYLQLPDDLPARVQKLAQTVTQGYSRPQDKAQALAAYLQGNYAYTTRLPQTAPGEPLDDFLFTSRRGHCEYFASALAILLRAIDIPSRSVNGYLGGEWNEYGRYLIVRQQHAHSWVEAFIPGTGWVTLDPTPLGPPLAPRSGLGRALHRAQQVSDSIELSWSKYVLEYDLRTQMRLVERLKNLLGSHSTEAPVPRPGSPLHEPRALGLLRALGYLVAGLGLGGAAVALWRRAQRRRRPEAQREVATQGQLKRALTVLRRRGFVQRPGETLQQLAARVEAAGDTSGKWFAEIVRFYYAHRFGEREIDLGEVAKLTRRMAREPRSSQAIPISIAALRTPAPPDSAASPPAAQLHDRPPGPPR